MCFRIADIHPQVNITLASKGQVLSTLIVVTIAKRLKAENTEKFVLKIN